MKLAKSIFVTLVVTLSIAGCQPDATKPEASATTGTTGASTTSTTPTPPADDIQGRKFQLRNLAVQDIKANGNTIHCWIMDTEAKRQEGMMFLKDGNVKADEGMLFVFRDIQQGTNGFWMHNTILPLDIIYIADDGKVLNIQKGQPFDETSLPAKGDYSYTLELKQGQAKKFGIGEGSKVEIPAGITASE